MSEKLISEKWLNDYLDGYDVGALVKGDLGAFTMLNNFRVALMEAPAVDAFEVEKVAEILCEATGDECACNLNNNDEWLPGICELQGECQYPADRLGCWKQFVKHYVKRREDNAVD